VTRFTAGPVGAGHALRPFGLFAAAALLASCSSAAPPPTKSAEEQYRADYDAALSLAKSEHLKGVLKDHKVTAAEYEESVRLRIKCVNDKFPQVKPPPFTGEKGANGLYKSFSFTGPDAIVRSPEASAAQDECWETYMGEAMATYEESRRNPEHLDPFELVKRCLVKAHLAPDSYSEANWRADQYYDVPGGGTRSSSGSSRIPPKSDATDVDAQSPEVMRCAG
jgi:hypothetical protein